MQFVFADGTQTELTRALIAYAGPRMGCEFDPDQTRGIGVVCEHGKAVVLYNNFRPEIGLDMHIAAEGNWCNRRSLAVFFSYPFVDLGMRRVTGWVEKKNKKARRLNEKLGFRQEGCLRKASPGGGDLIVYGMLRQECRWLREEDHGQEFSSAA